MKPSYEADAMVEEARRQRTRVDALFAPLDSATFARRPGPERWSVGDCLDHLTLAMTAYLDAIEELAPRARERGLIAEAARQKRRRHRHGWLGDAFIRSLEPPPRFKSRTFKAIMPQGRARDVVLPLFLGTQDRLIGSIEATRDLDLARVRMRSPFLRLLPLSLGQAFGAMLAHNRRHLWQAEGVLQEFVTT